MLLPRVKKQKMPISTILSVGVKTGSLLLWAPYATCSRTSPFNVVCPRQFQTELLKKLLKVVWPSLDCSELTLCCEASREYVTASCAYEQSNLAKKTQPFVRIMNLNFLEIRCAHKNTECTIISTVLYLSVFGNVSERVNEAAGSSSRR